MKKENIRNAVSLIVGFYVLWYVGAMSDFFPFFGTDSMLKAIGFTGLLICAVVVLCTCWILSEIQEASLKQKASKDDE